MKSGNAAGAGSWSTTSGGGQSKLAPITAATRAAHGQWRSDMGRERAQKLPDFYPGKYLH